MANKFENKKLNKKDHADIERNADHARYVTGVVLGIGSLGVVAKKIPLSKVMKAGRTILKTISKI